MAVDDDLLKTCHGPNPLFAPAILTAVAADETPLRLPLGEDAWAAITAAADAGRAELAAWEQTIRGTDFDTTS